MASTTALSKRSKLSHLECSKCGSRTEANAEAHLCTCGKPYFARYDLAQAARTLTHQNLLTRPKNLWRYAEVLPGCAPLTLGEGMTPLVPAQRLGGAMGPKRLYGKDEAVKPTGSFKGRGTSVAVDQAEHFGPKALARPTA